MKRNALLAAAVAVAASLVSLPTASAVGLISEMEANRHGLTRPWFVQVEMDAGRSRVANVVLDRGVLYVQTNRAMIHAIDAETGRTLWTRLVGRPNHPSLTPGLNADLMAVVNGSRLYAVNRYTGEILFDIEVGGAPGAGAALSSKRAFVPMVSGLVMAYRLESMTDPLKELNKLPEEATEEQKAAAEAARRENIQLRQEYIPPLACQSYGRAMVPPLVTSEDEMTERVVWPTDRGYLNMAVVDKQADERFYVKYRMEAKPGIEARPVYVQPDPKLAGESGLLIAGGRDGFVYAIVERSGDTFWRFSAGDAIIRAPVLIDDRVFVCTQLGGMYCLDVKTGKDLWWAADIMQFVAAGKERVYAIDKLQRLLALSAKTGQRLDTITVGELALSVANAESDRLYLVDRRGLVQCLHEVQLSEPLRYNLLRSPDEKPAIQQEGMDVAAPRQPAAPKPAGAPAAGGADDPFK